MTIGGVETLRDPRSDSYKREKLKFTDMESIEKIIGNRYLVIPKNQRGFSWTEKELEELKCDLELAVPRRTIWADHRYERRIWRSGRG